MNPNARLVSKRCFGCFLTAVVIYNADATHETVTTLEVGGDPIEVSLGGHCPSS
ncbi:hypothetical protein ACFQ2A_21740 [Variovorax dokdonensis]